MRISLNNSNQSLLALAKFAAAILAILAVLFGTVEWLDSRYVSDRIFLIHKAELDRENRRTEEMLVQLFEAQESEREKDLNLIYKAIKDAAATALIVRRDILLTRGRSNLSSEELAELEIIETKLRDLNL